MVTTPGTSRNNLSQTYVQAIQTLVNSLSASEESGEEAQAVKATFARALEARTRIHMALEKETPVDDVLEVFNADQDLRKHGPELISTHKINLYHWRASAGVRDDNMWWWYLDHSNFAPAFWIVLTVVVLVSSLPYLIPTLNDISSLAIRIFSNVGIEDFVFDTFALFGALFQLGIGGSISIALTRRVSATFNSFLEGFRFFPRFLLPVNSPPIILAFFFLTIAVTNFFLLPQLERYYSGLAEQAVESGSLSSATSNLSVAMSTNSTSYANTLVQIGLEYENIGEVELAKDAYAEALLQDSRLAFARYLLANLLLDEGASQNATPLLDEGIQRLSVTLGETSITEDSATAEQRRDIQLLVLLLTTRGRAFLQLNSPSIALQDLLNAQDLLDSYDSFFTTSADFEKDEFLEPDAIGTLQFYYYLAQAYEARQRGEAELGNVQFADIYGDFALTAWEGVILLSDQDRNNYQARLWNLEANQRIEFAQ